MNNHELFSIIGSVEDAYLLELEQPQRRCLPRHFGLIAALITLLLTACAAPVITRSFDKVESAERSGTGNGCEVYVMVNGSRQWKYDGFRSSDAEVQVTAEPDAPKNLDTQYFPVQLLEYCTPEQCNITDTSLFMELSMKVPRYGKIYGIQYQQHVIPEDGNVIVPYILEDTVFMEQESRVYADVEALVFCGDITYENIPRGEPMTIDTVFGMIYSQIIFWSDGYYLYCLRIPLTYNLPVTEVEGIVTSLTAVEDITQYLTP